MCWKCNEMGEALSVDASYGKGVSGRRCAEVIGMAGI